MTRRRTGIPGRRPRPSSGRYSRRTDADFAAAPGTSSTGLPRQPERGAPVLRVLRYSLLYFVLVFAAGFALGAIRVLWLVPMLGERGAELAELPIMLTVIVLAARVVVGRMQHPGPQACLAIGALALAFMLVVEFTVVLGLRGLTLAQYLESRDPVAGAAYVVSLLVFMLMPSLLARRRITHPES